MATYGTWIGWRFSLATLYDRQVAEASRSLATWDSMLTVWQLRAGTVDLVHAAGRLRAGPGDWLLIPPGLARRHRFSGDASIRSVRCLVADAAGVPPGAGLVPLLHDDGDGALQAAADALQRLAPLDRDALQIELTPTAWAAMHAAVIMWCATACERLGITGGAVAVDARVAAAQRLLLARPSPAALPWSGLREATGLSRPQLDRLFRHHCGRSVRAWAEERMLAAACAALGDLAEPVKSVASRLGFGDASHFCRWFRQHAGATPADWRRHGGT